MDKMYAIFEHEFSISNNLPFRRVFENEPFKSYLFEEFCFAELKPCFWLYREQYYSQEETEKTMTEMNAKIPVYSGNEAIMAPTFPLSKYEITLNAIYSEFQEKQSKNILATSFFCPDIYKTPTIMILSKVENALDLFKESDSERDLYVEIVTGHLKAISKVDLRKKILEQLMDDDLNFAVLLQEDNGANYKRWQRKKFEFNHLIKNNFSDKQDDVVPEYSVLLDKLAKYITGINDIEFKNIIEHHSLSLGTPKAIWIGTPADAHRFAFQIKMKVADWNKCFKGVKDRSGNLRQLRPNDKEKEGKGSEITDILKNYFHK